MKGYDPLLAPDPEEWMALDEGERIQMVLTYHRKKRFELPNENLHASSHVIIENQIALGDKTPVRATLDRLMREGLDRHDAIHAIGCVLSSLLFNIVNDSAQTEDPNEAYYRGLEKLTAKSWLKEFGSEGVS